MKVKIPDSVVIIGLLIGLAANLIGVPTNREVMDQLMKPSERLESAIEVIRQSSARNEVASHLSILAARLWEDRRYSDARTVGELALQEWDQQLVEIELSGKEHAAIFYEKAKLHRRIFEDQSKFEMMVSEALKSDPENDRYKLAQKRQSPRVRPSE